MLAEPTTHTTEVEERVMRGARLLDEKVPGWEEKVNLKFLDMGDSFCCVLGQVYDDCSYGEALDSLGLISWRTSLDTGWHGFDQDLVARYDVLQHFWVEEITKRLEEEE